MGLNVLYDAAEGCRHSQELETSRHSFVNSFCHLWPSAFLYNSIISCFTVYIKLHWSICFCIVAIFSEKLFFISCCTTSDMTKNCSTSDVRHLVLNPWHIKITSTNHLCRIPYLFGAIQNLKRPSRCSKVWQWKLKPMII